MQSELPMEIYNIKTIVEKYFRVYDVRWDVHVVALYCTVYDENLEENFDALRKECLSLNYIPMIRHEQEEYVIYITKGPEVKYKGRWVNFSMLIATIITTVVAGSMQCVSYYNADFGEMFSARYLLLGLIFFSIPLMAILGTHELGHYYMSKRHGVKASLPFFIPVPPLPGLIPLGTFGAFISMREPIPDKKALLDIGIAGPICGFIVAIPVTIIGLYLTAYYHQPVPEDMSSVISLANPLLFLALAQLTSMVWGEAGNVLIHPTAFAGWVGLFVTAINLLPAGQLDGGHIFRGLLGEKYKYTSYSAVLALIILGFGIPGSSEFPGYAGWFLFALLIIFLGLKHPPPLNDITRLDNKRKVLGAFSILLLITTFVPVPFGIIPPEYSVDLEADETTKFLDANNSTTFRITVLNNGNYEDRITLSILDIDENLTARFIYKGEKEKVELRIGAKKNVTLDLSVTLKEDVEGAGDYNLTLLAKSNGDKEKSATLGLRVVMKVESGGMPSYRTL